MKLYAAAASPFARKVRVVMLETGQDKDITTQMIKTAPTNPNDELSQTNPLSKIPALTRDDGPAIYDSRVICRYLDDRAKAGLYPASRLYEVLTLEATADAMMDATVLMSYEARVRPAQKQFSDWTDAQWAKTARALTAIEERWMSHLSGPLNAAQIAVACTLGYIDFRHDARNWRKGHDKLAAWYAEFAKRPSMQATAPTD